MVELRKSKNKLIYNVPRFFCTYYKDKTFLYLLQISILGWLRVYRLETNMKFLLRFILIFRTASEMMAFRKLRNIQTIVSTLPRCHWKSRGTINAAQFFFLLLDKPIQTAKNTINVGYATLNQNKLPTRSLLPTF